MERLGPWFTFIIVRLVVVMSMYMYILTTLYENVYGGEIIFMSYI